MYIVDLTHFLWFLSSNSYILFSKVFPPPRRILILYPPSSLIVVKKSYVEVISNVRDIHLSQLSTPCVKGDRISIYIPEEEYIIGLESCKHNLYWRIIWLKGTTPLTVVGLREKLATHWSSIGKWGVTPLGKGFFELYFTSIEDVCRFRSISSWNLSPCVLTFFPLEQRFQPSYYWTNFYSGLDSQSWALSRILKTQNYLCNCE